MEKGLVSHVWLILRNATNPTVSLWLLGGRHSLAPEGADEPQSGGGEETSPKKSVPWAHSVLAISMTSFLDPGGLSMVVFLIQR